MTQKEDRMQIIKQTISASIKYNTHRGYIGWSDCDNICMDMHGCLDMCEESLQAGRLPEALEMTVYILGSGVKLASHADSSSGMLTDVVMRAYDVIKNCTAVIVLQDQQTKDAAFAALLKEAKKKAFDGWTDWRYDLLKCSICLCDEKSAKKLEKVLDHLLESAKEDPFPEYQKKEDLVARYLLHRHLRGKEAAKAELRANINVKEFCVIAIKDAMEEGDYREAERLCLEKIEAEKAWHYRRHDPEDWNNLLFHIYEEAKDTGKQAMQAKKLLLLGNETYWDVLKKLYRKDGVWEEKREELLDELKDDGQMICYRGILVKEKEKKRLLDDVQKNPYDLFYYGKYLVKDYPEQIYGLCEQEIRDHCVQARDRREYKKVTKQISQLIKWNGTDTAKRLIAEFKQAYPRRTALLDELEKMEGKYF